MELREGYIKTEVGALPIDWELKPFYKITDAITCGVAATPKYVDESEGKPFLSASHVQNGKVTPLDYKYIPVELYNQITKHNKPEKGDILYTRVGAGIGEAGVIDFDLDFAIYVSLTLIKPKKNLNSYYLKSLLNSDYYRFLAKRDQFAGGGVQNLNVGVVREFPIPIPPTIEEQTAIATALSDADALINSLEKLIEKKRNIKQGAMQQLLKPKEGWEVKPLKDVCWFQEGPGLRNWQFTNRGIKVINVTNLDNGILFLERTDRHISLEEFHKMYEHFEIDESDIVVASSGNSYGKVAVVRKQDLPLLMNTSVIRFRPLKGLDYNFLLIFLKSVHFKNQIDLLITGGAQPNFGPAHLNKTQINLPATIEEQKEIATILSDMDAEIQALETKLEKYRKIKLGMMQNLLTGKIRLV